MKFFNKELCEKLLKLGCVSETRFYWSAFHTKKLVGGKDDLDFNGNPIPNIQAFSVYDFLSDEEYSFGNCNKVFVGDWEGSEYERRSMLVTERKTLVDLDNQEAYIEESVNRVMNNE